MRTVKFRQWNPPIDDEPGEMIDGDSLAFEEYAPITHLLSNKNITQWTGLLDKNGKDIYEGDIFIREITGRRGVIEFDGGMFGINWDYGSDEKTMLGAWGSRTNLRVLNDGFNEEIEIVGNIFQNPELVKTR